MLEEIIYILKFTPIEYIIGIVILIGAIWELVLKHRTIAYIELICGLLIVMKTFGIIVSFLIAIFVLYRIGVIIKNSIASRFKAKDTKKQKEYELLEKKYILYNKRGI